jgi:hypothetical protein
LPDRPERDPETSRRDSIVPDRPPDVTLCLGVDRAGTLRSSYMGPALKGEHGSDFAAGALIFHLNRMGGSWSPPERATGRERGVDFTSSSSAGALAIQVTRIPQDPARWQRVHQGGHVSGAVDISLAAQDLIEAILQKGGKSRPNANADVTLVLDGSSDLAYMLENTLTHFEREFGAEARAQGFASIWLVTATQIVCLVHGRSDL